MKIATFRTSQGVRIGIGDGDELRDVSDIVSHTVGGVPDMLLLIRHAATVLPALAQAQGDAVDTTGIEWLPPVPRPGKICGIAMNNSASNERKISAPAHPAFFLKPASCLVGHGQPIHVRSYYGSVHPEPELAVVIGEPMRDVDAASAMDYVFGYTIFNDITGNGMRAEDLFRYWALYRDADGELEKREQHLSYAGRYKGTDTFGAMGPWLVTRDEVPDPDDLAVQCRVAGETIAKDSTRFYNYKVCELLSFISQFQTLEPGDIVSCGTAFKPEPGRKSIHHTNFQDVPGPVLVTIERLGTLSNPVVVEQRTIGAWRLASAS